MSVSLLRVNSREPFYTRHTFSTAATRPTKNFGRGSPKTMAQQNCDQASKLQDGESSTAFGTKFQRSRKASIGSDATVKKSNR